MQCDNYIRSDSSPRQGVGGAGAREYYPDTIKRSGTRGRDRDQPSHFLRLPTINEYYVKAIDWNRSKRRAQRSELV